MRLAPLSLEKTIHFGSGTDLMRQGNLAPPDAQHWPRDHAQAETVPMRAELLTTENRSLRATSIELRPEPKGVEMLME